MTDTMTTDPASFGRSAPSAMPVPASELAKMLDDFDRRLHQTEQFSTSTTLMGGTNDFPGGITIGGIPVNATNPNNVTSVTITQGSFYDNIFADVEWVEDTTGVDAVSFDVELEVDTTPAPAAATYVLQTIVSTAGTHVRFESLKPNWRYRTRVYPVSQLGVRPSATPVWNNFTTGQDSTVPPAVGTPVVARGATTVIVKFTPLTQAQAPDVANGHGIYEVQIDTSTGFASGNFRNKFTNDQVTGFNDITATGVWYARVRAIDSSGNVGPWSPTSTGVNAGAVDGVWCYSLNASEITTGTLSATVIGTASLPVDKIYSSTLSATVITLGTGGEIVIGSGGDIKIGNPTTNGIYINGAGIYAYGSSVQTLAIDAATGNISLKGSLTSGSTINGAIITAGELYGTFIATSASGKRIEFGGTGSFADDIYFYTGSTATEYFHANINTAWQGTGTGTDTYGYLAFNAPSHRSGVPGSQIVMRGPSANGATNGQITLSSQLSGGTSVFISNGKVQIASGYLEITDNGIYMWGTDTSDAIRGDWGGYGAAIRTRNGNNLTFEWEEYGDAYDGGLSFWIDTTHIDKLYIPGATGGRSGLHGEWGGYGGGLRTRDAYAAIFNVGCDGPSYISLNVDNTMVGGIDSANKVIWWPDGSYKAFTIQHPLEDDRWLSHACLEGPEAQVFYDGIGQLDNGIAFIELPAYFTALTHEADVKVQVSLEDDDSDDFWAPKYKLERNILRVRGPKTSRARFSWSVTAIRKDIPRVISEPKKSEVVVCGDGPYTYIKPKELVGG